MMRKMTSVRRWKARFRLGKFVPYVAAIHHEKLHRWLKRKNVNYQINRDGFLKA